MPKYINFGYLLKNIRESQGISQQKLAKEINSDRTIISNYERGKYLPKYSVLLKLSKTLNVPFMLFIEAISHDEGLDSSS